MPNRFRNNPGYRSYDVDSAQVITQGDAVYQEVDDVRSATALTYTSLAQAQADFAKKFVGIAEDASANGDTRAVTVRTRGVFEMDCASTTWEIGDRVAMDDNAGATALLGGQVIAAGENGQGVIGRVAKRYSVATTRVLVEIMPVELGNYMIPLAFPTQLITSAVDLVTDYPILFPMSLVQLDAIVTVLTAGAGVISVHKNATALDDTLTIPGASAVGAVVTQALDDASGDDILDMGDTISLVSDGTPTAGEASFILWVKPYLNES